MYLYEKFVFNVGERLYSSSHLNPVHAHFIQGPQIASGGAFCPLHHIIIISSLSSYLLFNWYALTKINIVVTSSLLLVVLSHISTTSSSTEKMPKKEKKTRLLSHFMSFGTECTSAGELEEKKKFVLHLFVCMIPTFAKELPCLQDAFKETGDGHFCG